MTQKSGLKKLKSKKQIDLVFRDGKAIRFGALVLHFIHPEEVVDKIYVSVGVSKRCVPKAFQRNRIKRQIRAVIRQNNEKILRSLSFGFYVFLYKSKPIVHYDNLSFDLNSILKKFAIYVQGT